MECPHCDVTVLDEAREVCPHCRQPLHGSGAAGLPVAIVVAARGRLTVTSPATDVPRARSAYADRFALARQDPAVHEALSAQVAMAPQPAGFYGRLAVPLLAGGGLMAVGLLLGPWGAMFAIPVALLFLVPAGRALRRAWRLARSPATTALACVVDAGGGRYVMHDDHDRDGPGREVIDRAVTLEFEDGQQRRFEAGDGGQGVLATGDVGVALIHDGVVLAFGRLPTDDAERSSAAPPTTAPAIATGGEPG